MRIVPKDLGLAWNVRFLLGRDSTEKVGAEARVTLQKLRTAA